VEFLDLDTLQKLASTCGLVLIKDHDPKPLLSFQADHRGGCGWDYLEKGPDV
jgi:uncharacterized protein (DUF2249 family)